MNVLLRKNEPSGKKKVRFQLLEFQPVLSVKIVVILGELVYYLGPCLSLKAGYKSKESGEKKKRGTALHPVFST